MNDVPPPRSEDADLGWIDALLRRAAPPLLADDDFTAGVMRRLGLPASRSMMRERWLARWTLGGAVAGALIAAVAGAFAPAAIPDGTAWQSGPVIALVQAWPSLLLAMSSAAAALLVLDDT